ncbi:tetratricopeptide repeat protein [Chthonobacter rhizosphaerae]|uniref:tetratricopeptide repeat protein n=1 Tax=Chthonobacter rhizosphaerae TaxID=2735553 RepID=UPI0015EE7808|nr:hypothetical protein [Chthonobacter rhizosphaerae]
MPSGSRALTDLLDGEDLRLLADIGFIAATRGLHGQAGAIFAALQALRPDTEAPSIGLALTDLAAGRPQDALDRLARGPRTPAVLVFQGIAAVRCGRRRDAVALFGRLIADHPDQPAADLARAVLAELDGSQATGLSSLFADPRAVTR